MRVILIKLILILQNFPYFLLFPPPQKLSSVRNKPWLFSLLRQNRHPYSLCPLQGAERALPILSNIITPHKRLRPCDKAAPKIIALYGKLPVL